MKPFAILSLLICVFSINAPLIAQESAKKSVEKLAKKSAKKSVEKLAPELPPSVAKSRSFDFNYGATIVGAPRGSQVRVWIPIAETNPEQQVTLVKTNVPAPLQFNQDSTYQNQIGYFETNSSGDPLSFQVDYRVTRREAGMGGTSRNLQDQINGVFLKSNSLVPIDGKPIELLDNIQFTTDSFATAKSLYEVVESHLTYDKSKPGYGNGDTVWACDSRTGNCTDFHSLFISLARSRSIAAKFEIGFPLGPETSGDVPGYHCWAWFHAPEKGWVPVDISEADKHPELKDYYFGKLTADRVAFSTGRDIRLVPAAVNPSQNYFVYPHIEVDGKVWPKEKVQLKFQYENRFTQQQSQPE